MSPIAALLPALLLSIAPPGPTAEVAATAAPASPSPSPFENAEVSRSGRVLAPFGLFPLWENTAALVPKDRAYLGTGFLGVGLTDRVQLGTSPLRFALRAPNVSLKVAVWEMPKLRLAAHAEIICLLPGAENGLTVSNFPVRLDTRGAMLWVMPIGATATYALRPSLFLHGTLTAQGIAARGLGFQEAFGASAQLEWHPFNHHALALHGGEVGLYRHDYFQAGASYRYHRSVLEASIGYMFRFYKDGVVRFPAFSLGVEL